MIFIGVIMIFFNMIMIAEIVGLYRLNERRKLKNTIIFMVLFDAVVITLLTTGVLIDEIH